MNRTFVLIFSLAIVCFSVTVFAADPLSAGTLTLKITQSGFLYVQEPMATAAIVLAIPQNTPNQIVQRFVAQPDSETIRVDGNSLLKIRWSGLKTGAYNYTVQTVIRVVRPSITQSDISYTDEWLAETDRIQIPNRIRELAWNYRYPTNLDGVADIVSIAHSMLTFDPLSKPRTTEGILNSNSGDGTAHAILLTSILRAAGVPTRIVTGDAWNGNSMSNHAWTEVLAGDWVPFDSAFLRGGSVSSYVTKWAGNDLPPERLEFIGGGNVAWEPNPDMIEVINSNEALSLDLSPIEPSKTFANNLQGWFGVTLKPKNCNFWKLYPLSCIDANKRPLLSFQMPERVVWSCDAKDVFWMFDLAGSNYICPIRVNAQTGEYTNVNITANDVATRRNISIEGFDTVAAYQDFNLVALGTDPARENEMLFFSPTLNVHNSERTWTLNLKPGTYDFYLWFDGSIAKKTVNVIEQKEFAIALSAPSTAAIDEDAQIRVDVTNLKDVPTNAIIKLKADNTPENICWIEDGIIICSDQYATTVSLEPLETRSFDLTVTLTTEGRTTMTASAEHDSAAFVSKKIQVIVPSEKRFERALQTLSNGISYFLSKTKLITRITTGMF